MRTETRRWAGGGETGSQGGGPGLGVPWEVVGYSGVEQTCLQVWARNVLVLFKVLDLYILKLCQVLKGAQ